MKENVSCVLTDDLSFSFIKMYSCKVNVTVPHCRVYLKSMTIHSFFTTLLHMSCC